MTGTVLEEGLRGSGGWLLDGNRERFMQKYDARQERATRDVVSRSIFREMRTGRPTPNGGVYIQMHHLGPDNVRRQFKGMVDRCADCGFDLAGGLVEVVPTAHYMMGGVVFRPDCSTELEGLFAAGEDTGGVHGANRLGGNGVANSTVFGGIAGETMADWLGRNRFARDADEEALRASIAAHEAPFTQKPGDLNALREELYACMWDEVGILRTAEGLRRGGRRPRLQPHLARLAQPRQSHRGEPRHRHRRARPRGFARRALPRGLSAGEFAPAVRIHGRPPARCGPRAHPRAGALLAREAGRVAHRKLGTVPNIGNWGLSPIPDPLSCTAVARCAPDPPGGIPR
jgi:aspartate oxidase